MPQRLVAVPPQRIGPTRGLAGGVWEGADPLCTPHVGALEDRAVGDEQEPHRVAPLSTRQAQPGNLDPAPLQRAPNSCFAIGHQTQPAFADG